MKNKNCMYGYIDESGSPGIAINNNDYFMVSVVLFSSLAKAEKAMRAIDRLRNRLGLPDNYEFHRKNNTVDKQQAFVSSICKADFSFVVVAIKKTASRKAASYANMAILVAHELATLPSSYIKIKMDINPILHRELAKELKIQNLKSIRIREQASHKETLLQLADYVVNLSYGILKKSRKAQALYSKIEDKEQAFIVKKLDL